MFVLLAGLLLTGCSPSLFVKADERALATQIFTTIEQARGSEDAFAVPAASDLKAGAYRRLAEVVPRGRPELVGAYRHAGSRGQAAVLTYAMEGQGRSALVSIRMTRAGGQVRADDLSIIQLPRPLSELKGFRAHEAPTGAFILLLAPLLTLGIAAAAIIRVWRSGRFGYRWLWTLGCLLGLAELRILWPTGRFIVQPLYVSLLPAGARQIGPVPDSWLIAASMPVVAIIVLVIRRTKQPKGEAMPPV